MVLIIEIIVNPRNLLYINHRFRKGGKLVAKMVKHLISQVLCQQNLHVTILYYYWDTMAVTYWDIGFSIITQPYSILLIWESTRMHVKWTREKEDCQVKTWRKVLHVDRYNIIFTLCIPSNNCYALTCQNIGCVNEKWWILQNIFFFHSWAHMGKNRVCSQECISKRP